MTDFDQETYQPDTGDFSIQMVRPGHVAIHWYVRQQWEQHGIISEQEAQDWIASRKLTFIGESKEKHQYYRQDIPQFFDGSGWDLENEKAPYFYEHITLQNEKSLKRQQRKILYKIVMILPGEQPYHKNTYFVKGSHLDRFLQTHKGYSEYFVSIELAERMSSTDEKLI